MRTATALARLRGCAGSHEPSLVAHVISTIIMAHLVFLVSCKISQCHFPVRDLVKNYYYYFVSGIKNKLFLNLYIKCSEICYVYINMYSLKKEINHDVAPLTMMDAMTGPFMIHIRPALFVEVFQHLEDKELTEKGFVAL